ncbi:MAG: hypothetical protein ACON5D_06785 [Rubripirellula sp.]
MRIPENQYAIGTTFPRHSTKLTGLLPINKAANVLQSTLRVDQATDLQGPPYGLFGPL